MHDIEYGSRLSVGKRDGRSIVIRSEYLAHGIGPSWDESDETLPKKRAQHFVNPSSRRSIYEVNGAAVYQRVGIRIPNGNIKNNLVHNPWDTDALHTTGIQNIKWQECIYTASSIRCLVKSNSCNNAACTTSSTVYIGTPSVARFNHIPLSAGSETTCRVLDSASFRLVGVEVAICLTLRHR